MLKQLLKQIWTQRKTNTWLWVELLIVFLCLSYVVDYLHVTGSTYYSPLGYHIDHVYHIKLAEVPSNSPDYLPDLESEVREEQFLSLLERMRTYPGIESVSLSNGSFPYNTSHSTGLRRIDSTGVHGNVYRVSAQYFKVFRVTDKNGQIDPLVGAAMQERTMVINEEAEKKYLEEGVDPMNAGMKNFNGTEPYITVRAVCADTRYDEFSTPYPSYYECRTESGLWKMNGVDIDVCVRVSKDADSEEYVKTLRKDLKNLLRVGNFYLMEIISFDDIRNNYYRGNGKINNVKTHMAGLAFLSLNIFLGVIGTFWVRTQQRRSEIGLRLALGSSYSGIRKLLISEGLVIFILAAIPASILAGNLFFNDIMNSSPGIPFTITRFLIGQIITCIIIILMIVAGILSPAHQAMKIKPAIALHEE